MKTLFSTILFFSLVIEAIAQTDIYVDLTIPPKITAGQSYPIEITIHKEGVTGFAKLELYLPVGVELSPLDTKSATFIKQSQLVKYIWIELPVTDELKLTATMNIDYRISGYKEIYGNFYCIVGKNKNKVSVGIIPFQIFNDNAWKNSTKKVDEYPVSNITGKIKPEMLALPKAYRIQIGAFKRRVSKSQLAEIFEQTDFIKEEVEDGWYKYMIGDFKTMDDAKQFKIQCGIYNSFIVLYENGMRISIP